MSVYRVIIITALLLISMTAGWTTAQVLDDSVAIFSSTEWISTINADTKDNVFAVTASAGKNVYFSYSQDYGKQWADFQKINEYPGSADVIIVGEQTELFIFWLEQKNDHTILKYKRCEQYGSLCMDTIEIAHNIYPYDEPIVRLKDGKLYLLYSKIDKNSLYIIFRKSNDNGITWNQELILNKNISHNRNNIVFGVAGDLYSANSGRIFTTWVENKGSLSIAFAESSNDGVSFQRAELVAKAYKIHHCDDCILPKGYAKPRIIEDTGRLFLFFIKKSGAKSDLYAAVLKDNDKKWEKPVKLTKGFSYIKDYSFINSHDTFIMNLFWEDKEKELLYYSEIRKSQLDKTRHIFLIDNKVPGIIFKDDKENKYLLFARNDAVVKESVLFLSKIEQNSQVEGDADNDEIPDKFEDQLLNKFRPQWLINRDDPAQLPVSLEENSCKPKVKAVDGTIYGEVFRPGSCMEKICECGVCTCTTYHFLEIHFFDLWGKDTLVWPFRRHDWDQEHVSTRVVHVGHDNPTCEPNWHPSNENEILWNVDEWNADLWRFSAHEGTLCEKIKYRNGKRSEGIDVWVSYRHGTFPGDNSCNKPFRFWCSDGCYGDENLGKPVPINIGQVGYPLNGACWTDWNGFLSDKMDPDVPALVCRYRESCNAPHQ